MSRSAANFHGWKLKMPKGAVAMKQVAEASLSSLMSETDADSMMEGG
jgi:hypothetical protein